MPVGLLLRFFSHLLRRRRVLQMRVAHRAEFFAQHAHITSIIEHRIDAIVAVVEAHAHTGIVCGHGVQIAGEIGVDFVMGSNAAST